MTNKMNLKSKIAKCVLAGTCFTLISAGSAFAAEPANAGAGVSSSFSLSAADSVLTEKHRAIDALIFEQGGLEKFQDMGFTVTSTGPVNGIIEIGITPYDESYAEAIYDLVGSDQVQVVEGVQAVTLMAGADGAPAVIGEEPEFTTMVVGGPEPGEGEAAITSIPVDSEPSDTPVSDSDDAVSSGVVHDAELISAPADEEAQLISAPLDGEETATATTSANHVWPWVAGAAALLAAAALIIRKAAGSKK